MNPRQRHFLVSSLRSLSVILATICLILVIADWLPAAAASPTESRLSSPLLFALLLSAGAVLWLARFVTLGEEVPSRSLDRSNEPLPRKLGEDCPPWPTVLSWLVADLSGEDAQRISTHVSGCDNCRKRLALMSAVQEMASDRGR